MAHILIVGMGDLGSRVAQQLATAGHHITGVRRSNVQTPAVTLLQADVSQPQSIEALRDLTPDIVLYCVAADGQSDAQYAAQYVTGLQHVLAAQSHNPNLQHVFFVSSTRVYGQHTDALLDEQTPVVPADFGGERLLEAEQVLADFTKKTGKAGTVLRLSGIYGPGRLRMIRLAKSPQDWPAADSWTNRIHRDDAAAFIVFLMQQALTDAKLEPCYLVTDSEPATQLTVLRWLADTMQLEAGVSNSPVSITSGKRLSNQAMCGTGYVLQYPDFRAGYAAMLIGLKERGARD